MEIIRPWPNVLDEYLQGSFKHSLAFKIQNSLSTLIGVRGTKVTDHWGYRRVNQSVATSKIQFECPHRQEVWTNCPAAGSHEEQILDHRASADVWGQHQPAWCRRKYSFDDGCVKPKFGIHQHAPQKWMWSDPEEQLWRYCGGEGYQWWKREHRLVHPEVSSSWEEVPQIQGQARHSGKTVNQSEQFPGCLSDIDRQSSKEPFQQLERNLYHFLQRQQIYCWNHFRKYN